MIEYINIFYKEYVNISEEAKKGKSYCVEFADGSKGWFVKGLYHREDGPAILTYNGEKYWYLNGQLYYFEEWLKLTPISDEEKVFLRLKYS